MTYKKSWFGTPPTECQICNQKLTRIFFDACLGGYVGGPWALLCHGCFARHLCRLGLGLGQAYSLDTLEQLSPDVVKSMVK